MLLLTVLCCTLRGEDASGRTSTPNVVLIIGDDQAWTDFGFMGHEAIRTPNLDRLAAESAFFPRAYVTTSLCRPSLATLISGLYPHQHHITGNDPALPRERRIDRPRHDPAYLAQCEAVIHCIDDVPKLPALLGARGYESFQSGKWWEGHYSRGGFSEGMTHGDPKRGGRHGDEGLRIGREGMQPVFAFIDRAVEAEKPFFLWYAPFLPHTPHNAPERILARYRKEGRPRSLARYYAMCEWFDETCGALLRRLDERGIARDTLVVFISDNGWIQRTPTSSVPEKWNQSFAPRSKQSPYDGGIRTPLLVRWPGRIEPRKFDEMLVNSIDVAPTILAACGVERDPRMHGVNLLEVCDGRAPSRERIFGEVFAHDIADVADPSRTILYRWCIEGHWKLILTEAGEVGRYRVVHPRQHREPQLFDLVADPYEKRDRAAERADVVARLQRELDAWWRP